MQMGTRSPTNSRRCPDATACYCWQRWASLHYCVGPRLVGACVEAHFDRCHRAADRDLGDGPRELVSWTDASSTSCGTPTRSQDTTRGAVSELGSGDRNNFGRLAVRYIRWPVIHARLERRSRFQLPG